MKSLIHYKKDSVTMKKIIECGPIPLQDCGPFEPRDFFEDEYDDELFNGPAGDIYKEMFKKDKRPSFELEEVLPKDFLREQEYAPIFNITDLYNHGEIDFREAQKRVKNIIKMDYRCIAAHIQLGCWYFNCEGERAARKALSHYKLGSAIAYHAIENHLDAVFPWGLIDNRDMLRSFHGLGLSFWRLGRTEDAMKVFIKTLWLCPTDNLGVRFCIDAIKTGTSWEEME